MKYKKYLQQQLLQIMDETKNKIEELTIGLLVSKENEDFRYLYAKQLENDKYYCLNDFPVNDVAHDTALAEIEDKKVFDEFGNLAIDLDSKKALDLENANGFVIDLTTQESCNEIINDIFSGESEENFDAIYTLKIEKQRELIVKYFTNTYKYVFVKAPNVYQIVEEDLFIKE